MGCITGKLGYATEDLAKQAMYFSQVNKEPSRKFPIRVFYCEYCGRWHMTSQEKKDK